MGRCFALFVSPQDDKWEIGHYHKAVGDDDRLAAHEQDAEREAVNKSKKEQKDN
jgi:hypothetical protein